MEARVAIFHKIGKGVSLLGAAVAEDLQHGIHPDLVVTTLQIKPIRLIRTKFNSYQG